METKKLHNYLVVIFLILVIIFFSNLFSRKSSGPEVKELIAGTGQSQQQSCDPPMEWIAGECVDPGAGGGGGGGDVVTDGGGGGVALPTVTTSVAINITPTGAMLRGNINSNGGENNSSRGFNYGTTQSYGTSVSENGSFSVGEFTATLSNLTCDTDYYFRAYSINSAGTSSGNAQTFTTDPCPTPPNNNPSGPGEGTPPGDNQNPSTGPSSGSTGNTPPTTVISTPTLGTNQISKSSYSGASIVPPPDLFLWNFGSNVYYLQLFLNSKGFLLDTTGLGSPGQETRTFGPKTEEALKRFQKAYGLPVTGYYGPLTWEAMTKLQLGH